VEDSEAVSETIPRFSAHAAREAFLFLALDASRIMMEGDLVLVWIDVFWREDCGTKALVVARPVRKRRDVNGDFIVGYSVEMP
jgi:hypothetical protein